MIQTYGKGYDISIMVWGTVTNNLHLLWLDLGLALGYVPRQAGSVADKAYMVRGLSCAARRADYSQAF